MPRTHFWPILWLPVWCDQKPCCAHRRGGHHNRRGGCAACARGNCRYRPRRQLPRHRVCSCLRPAWCCGRRLCCGSSRGSRALFFFKHYSDKVMQYVFVLAMVFLASVSAQLIGLEPVLEPSWPVWCSTVMCRCFPLMSSIEFVGNAIFIPYFLIGVGMMINLRVLADGSTLAISAVMLTVALVSKWLPHGLRRSRPPGQQQPQSDVRSHCRAYSRGSCGGEHGIPHGNVRRKSAQQHHRGYSHHLRSRADYQLQGGCQAKGEHDVGRQRRYDTPHPLQPDAHSRGEPNDRRRSGGNGHADAQPAGYAQFFRPCMCATTTAARPRP